MKKRFFAALLALAMALALLPATALAAGESGIQLGTSGIGEDDEVYFGKYDSIPINWNVKSAATGSLAVYSEYVLWDAQYHNSDRVTDNPGLTYDTSQLYTNTLPGFINNTNNFSTIEKAFISGLGVSQNEGAATNRSGSGRNYWIAKAFTTYNWGGTDLWQAYFVDSGGHEYNYRPFNYCGVRPAFNLNLNSVLFTSAAVGGNSSGAEGAGALNSNLTPSSGATSWKLTLRDNTNHGTFDVSTSTVSTTTAGGSVSITYSGATVGTNEYLSAMLVNGSNEVLYYGRLNQLTTGEDSGTQDITIPALTAGTYTLKIFNEQYNEDKNTDYSSALKDVTLTVSAPVASAAIGDVTISGTENTLLTSQTATITLTNDTFTNTSYANCASWFTNLPTDITASATVAGGNVATITFGGTPTATSTAVMAITIPSTALTGGTALTVTTNTNAKYNIVAPAFVAVMDISMTNAASVQVNTDLPLAGTVTPTTATNKTIVWSLHDANGTGATVSNSGVFHATTAGTATVKATVTNGVSATADYEETFDITVTAAPTPVDPTPTITDPVQAKTVTATVGSTATFTVTAVNATGYQWYIDRGDGSGWQTIAGANAANYTTTAVTMANDGYRYYCRISNASGYVDSPIFTLNVIEQPDIPATGDSTMPGLWIGIMMLAGMGLAASVVLGRRKRHSN